MGGSSFGHGGMGGHRSASTVTVSGLKRERGGFRHLGHLKRLGPYVRRYALALGTAVAALLLARFFEAMVPLFMKSAIDSIVDPNIELNLMWPAVAILGVVVARFIIFIYARRTIRRISIAVAYDLRKRLFAHIQIQGPNFFNRFSTGDLMSRAVNDIGMVRRVVSFGWVNIMTFVFSVSVGLYFMIDMSSSLTMWVVLPLPLVAISGFVMSRALFPYYRDQQEGMAAVTSFTQENLNGIRTIQAMAQEEEEIRRFNEISTDYAHKVYRATRYNAYMNLIMPLLTAVSPVIILFYGGSLVLSGEITLGTFAAFFSYLVMVTGPVRMLGMSLAMFTSAAAGSERLFEVLDNEPEIRDEPNDNIPDQIKGRVEFRNLTYRHPGAARPTIENINIDIQAGETVAFLGRVGSGKSTIFRAAVRLLATPRNSVFIDGHDICDFPIRRLREVATLIPQDPFLFSETIRANLTYDDPDRPDEPIWNAADAAVLAQTIEQFEAGLMTAVGERGITLSGGQKQRSTLARGLIREAPILLMDDCFSSVDTETEERILSGLQRLRAGKTTLLISHRVSTARHADRIFVIDNGHVLESGSHEELLALGGYYADLEAIQSNQDEDRARKSKLLHDLEEQDNEIALTAGGGS